MVYNVGRQTSYFLSKKYDWICVVCTVLALNKVFLFEFWKPDAFWRVYSLLNILTEEHGFQKVSQCYKLHNIGRKRLDFVLKCRRNQGLWFSNMLHWYNPYIFVNFPICILWVLFDIHFSQNSPGWHLWWNPVLSGVVEVYISYMVL